MASYSGGDSDPEDAAAGERLEEEDGLVDWRKMACLLCRRQFPNGDALRRHTQLSDLHKVGLSSLGWAVSSLGLRPAQGGSLFIRVGRFFIRSQTCTRWVSLH